MFVVDSRVFHDMDEVKNFPIADGDVVIAGFPKSGTNWMQVMLANLWDDWTTTKNSDKRVPNLTGPSGGGLNLGNFQGYEACIAVGSPRLMKFHPERELMPRGWPEHGKVIHIARNPKDVCVSYFHQFKDANGIFDETNIAVPDFNEHLDKFLRGEVIYGPYLNNVLSWRTFEHPSLHKVTYEDMKADTKGELLRIIEFLGKPVDEARLDEVVAATEFEAMKSNEYRFQINVPDIKDGSDNPFLRAGRAGAWKREMTVEISERIDRELVKTLEENGVFFKYE